MDTPLVSSVSARRISVDWSLAAITLIAVALLAGTTIRTGPDRAPGTPVRSGGLEVLGPGETLVAFEDFSFGDAGWTSTVPRARLSPATAYGLPETGAVAKRFDLPEGTARVRVAFDLDLDETRADDFRVRVNGDAVIDGAAGTSPANAMVERRGAAGDYSVWIVVDDPGAALSLEVEVAAPPGRDAAWSIDNVSVVATGPTS